MDVTQILREDHGEIRSQLAQAVKQRGPVGEAAVHLAHLCVPHFEMEEQILFPTLATVHKLVYREMRPDLVDLHDQIAGLTRENKRFSGHHQAIAAAVETLLQAAYRDGNAGGAELGHTIRNHERLESDLDFSAYEFALLAKSRC
jgi:hypothetical protein